MAREITLHHDGHGLNESILIQADAPGPGGASHAYKLAIAVEQTEHEMACATRRSIASGPGCDCIPQKLTVRKEVGRIQFQKGPRNEPGSTPGVVEAVLLAIVEDRMAAFQAGPFACPENGEVLEWCKQARAALKKRADARKKRGVLGKNKK